MGSIHRLHAVQLTRPFRLVRTVLVLFGCDACCSDDSTSEVVCSLSLVQAVVATSSLVMVQFRLWHQWCLNEDCCGEEAPIMVALLPCWQRTCAAACQTCVSVVQWLGHYGELEGPIVYVDAGLWRVQDICDKRQWLSEADF